MKIFYDCEFIENGTTIDLISIGMVTSDGREYYAISEEFDHQALLSGRVTHGCPTSRPACTTRWPTPGTTWCAPVRWG